MHGGSYDIAFRNQQGQISPQTINAEALGGSAGVATWFAPKAVTPLTSGRSFLYNKAQQHPLATSILINQARDIPVVGKHIPDIAGVLPFLLPKGQTEGEPLFERDATGRNTPYAGEAEEEPSLVERDATRTNITYAGEEELSPEEAAAHATYYIQDESAHIPEGEECLGVVKPSGARIICISSAAPGWFGDQCSL